MLKGVLLKPKSICNLPRLVTVVLLRALQKKTRGVVESHGVPVIRFLIMLKFPAFGSI